MIKRYKMIGRSPSDSRIEPVESGDGEWVRWKDVQFYLARIEYELSHQYFPAEVMVSRALDLCREALRGDNS